MAEQKKPQRPRPRPVSARPEPFALGPFAAAVLGAYAPPSTPFDPSGTWELGWRIVQHMAPANTIGRVSLRRRPAGDGEIELTLQRVKIGAGRQREETRLILRCRLDRVASLVSWEGSIGCADAEGRAVPELVRSVRGRAGDYGEADRRLGSLFSLIEAVQRWRPDAREAATFTLLDEFDRACPGQTIRPGAVVEIEAGPAGPIALRPFHHLGAGTVPVIYWVDPAGRVVLVVRGLEAYGLEMRSAPA